MPKSRKSGRTFSPARQPQGRVEIRHESQQQITISPLPAPEQMAAFDAVLPGLADRITKMAEGHAANRWRNDRAQRFVTYVSPVFAFIVAMAIICGGLYLTFTGRPYTGLAAVFGTVAAIITAMNFARRPQGNKP